MAVCDYCALKADVTITSDRKQTYTYPELECRFFQEQASKPSGLQMFHRVAARHRNELYPLASAVVLWRCPSRSSTG